MAFPDMSSFNPMQYLGFGKSKPINFGDGSEFALDPSAYTPDQFTFGGFDPSTFDWSKAGQGLNVDTSSLTKTPGWFGIDGLGKNMDTLKTGIGGLQTLSGLYMGLSALDVAKKQLALSSRVANANLANQTKSYNTSLTDRATARGVAEGQSQSVVDDYIKKNSLAGS